MKKSFLPFILAVAVLCSCKEQAPRADHVVYMCFDAMSAIGIQRANTPNFNYMIENGAVSLHTRCGLPSNSSPNWMTIASAAPFEMTGVLDNGVSPHNGTVIPALKNAIGFFPTIFEYVREQKPDAKIYFFGESSWATGMYDMNPFDVVVPERGKRMHLTPDEAIHQAADAFVADRPDLMFVAIGTPDHEGHTWGHESQGYFDCLHHMDRLVGDFVKKLEDNDLMENTVIVITADHGGINYGHGGPTMAELEVPVIMYGGPVTKGKVMERINMNYDTPATVAGLLGVELPWECHGKFIIEAFEPKTDICYVPVPLVQPFRGTVSDGGKVSISVDTEGAEIFFTLDGSQPTCESTKYEGPFTIDQPCTVSAVAYKNGNYGLTASNFLYAALPEGKAAVHYKLWRNVYDVVLPDFSRLGKPAAQGYISAFSLEDVPFEANEDDFAIIFSSKVNIKEAGKYKFELSSDDGAKLFIDGKCIADNDGSHTLQTKYGFAELEPGLHDIRVEYFEDCEGQYLYLNYGREGGPLRPFFPDELVK